MLHVWKRRLLLPTLIYLFFKIIGLTPFSMKLPNPNSDSCTGFMHSYFGLAYNGILIIVTLVLSIPAAHAFSSVEFNYNTKTVVTIGLIKAVAGTIVCLIIWLFVCLKQRRAVKIANKIVEADNIMIRLRYIYLSESKNFHIIAIIAVNIFIWINVFWLDLMVFEAFLKSTFIISMIPNFIFSWFLIQYSLALMLLETKFRAVNRGIYRLSMTNCSLLSADRAVIKNLLDIKASHAMLYDISCEMISFYSFPVMLIITALCGAILTTSYYSVMPFLAKYQTVSWLATFNSLAYLAMEVYPIVILSTTVTRVTHEMKCTASAVHKLLTQFTSNKHVKSELKIFSLELLHRHIEFTGCGIFSLDCTLLHSIASMTVTYLVILVQFQSGNRESPDSTESYASYENTLPNAICAVNNCIHAHNRP